MMSSLVDLFAGVSINLDIADAVVGFSVDLMETDLFALGARGNSAIGHETRERRRNPFQ
jgi:hypothetical protein